MAKAITLYVAPVRECEWFIIVERTSFTLSRVEKVAAWTPWTPWWQRCVVIILRLEMRSNQNRRHHSHNCGSIESTPMGDHWQSTPSKSEILSRRASEHYQFVGLIMSEAEDDIDESDLARIEMSIIKNT